MVTLGALKWIISWNRGDYHRGVIKHMQVSDNHIQDLVSMGVPSDRLSEVLTYGQYRVNVCLIFVSTDDYTTILLFSHKEISSHNNVIHQEAPVSIIRR